MDIMTSRKYRLAPWVSIVLAFVAAALGMWGAWEFGLKLEHGEANYLAIAAPVIALAAALIPPLAESDWRAGHWFKSLCWWSILAPCAAVVFFSSAERVHLAKSGAEAERFAARAQVERLHADLQDAKKEALAARKDSAKVADGKNKGERRERNKKAVETSQGAAQRVAEVEAKLAVAEARATVESELKAPSWLLPISLDLVAFIAMWSGISGLGGSKGVVVSGAVPVVEVVPVAEKPRRSLQPGSKVEGDQPKAAKKPRKPSGTQPKARDTLTLAPGSTPATGTSTEPKPKTTIQSRASVAPGSALRPARRKVGRPIEQTTKEHSLRSSTTTTETPHGPN